jgi:hypothetical protein
MIDARKWFALSLVMLGLTAGSSSEALADLTITVTPSLAPNAFGSPSYSGYVSNAIGALETGATSAGDPNSPTYYQAIANGASIDANQIIVSGFPSWLGQADPGTAFGPAYANELGNRLLFGLSITSNSGQTFSISELSFAATSSDAGNSLGFGFGQGSYNYSSDYVGVIYGAGGAADTSDYTYVTSGSNTQPVNAIYGRGSGNAYDVYETDPGATDQDKLNNAMAAIPGSTFTGTYSIEGFTGSGSVNIDSVNPNASPTPEPSTFVMAATAGLAGLAYSWRRRKRSA